MKQLVKRLLTDKQLRAVVYLHGLLSGNPLVAAKRMGLVRLRYRQLAQIVDAFDGNAGSPDVLYLGDSVVERVSRNDADRRTLGTMVTEAIRPDLRATWISHSAYHLGVFSSLLRVLECTRHRPDVVVFPINLRSFSPQWHFNPQWQFHEEINAIERYLANPSAGIPRVRAPWVRRREWEEFDATCVEYPETAFRRVGQFRDVIASFAKDEAAVEFRRRQIFIFHYLNTLSQAHPRLAILDSVLKLLDNLGCSVLCYITPVNYSAGIRYVDTPFLTGVRRNVAAVAEVVKRHQGPRLRFADHSELLDSQYFFNEHDAAEHLNERGRRELTSKLAAEVVAAWRQRSESGTAIRPRTDRSQRQLI